MLNFRLKAVFYRSFECPKYKYQAKLLPFSLLPISTSFVSCVEKPQQKYTERERLIMAQVIAREVYTHMPYLARDELYNEEKPFGADFPVDHFEGGELAHHIFDNKAITGHDVRGREPPALDRNGFCFIKAPTSLTAAGATNSLSPPVAKYLGEIERILYKTFSEYSRIEIMDFQVCNWIQE
jgi:hypothetical protein